MNLSIVIPVLNGEKYINECIDCINNLEKNDDIVNVIVVDNGSTDSTIEILVNKNIEQIVRKGVTISALRNIGARMTDNEYIAFVDSDCYVDKMWLKNLKKAFINDDCGVVGRYYCMSSTDSTWVEKLWCLRRSDISGSVKFLPGGNMVFRRSVFDLVGGFDEELITGEDYDICSRVISNGYSIVNYPGVDVVHMGNYKRLKDIIVKERWYGKGMMSSCRRPSKPLIASIAFLLCILMFVFFLLFNYNLLFIPIICLIAVVVLVSVSFSSFIKYNKFVFIVKMMPISLCYLLGRCLSLFDHFYYTVKASCTEGK
ncbi:hypothetical protein C2E25_09925 [Geothermobacter hydrogeniphilus]|uniref:Glycosyltransferase 2-like domain-containing protein n=1 Tax=Geothermobacter hydrogeniphilus TaxID=1969733 RepID=A0A2K2H9S8_9BACT|nr:glycosyltransferase [Geothermobacter hydrogeniphilus]PNU19979.1 hypothetical protein C2E25_09925 [Geothermobacter hydrogeniphilus]